MTPAQNARHDLDEPAALELRQLTVRYDRGDPVLDSVDLQLHAGEAAVILGPNGAGKTTLVRAIAGAGRATGIRTTGTIALRGADITRRRSSQRARLGICTIPERDKVFRSLTVAQNLELATRRRRRHHHATLNDDLDSALTAFPVLAERRATRAGLLSGGEQQVLALAGGLLARPDVLVVDEPSLGLAPVMIATVISALGRIRAETGTALLLAEQAAWAAEQVADRTFTLDRGRLVERTGAIDRDVLAANYLTGARS